MVVPDLQKFFFRGYLTFDTHFESFSFNYLTVLPVRAIILVNHVEFLKLSNSGIAAIIAFFLITNKC